MKKISVVIPTYNRADTILRAITSVLEQSYPVEEIIVVDDASTDHTKEIVSRIEDERIQYILLEENAGVANARNVGVLQAKGDWIAFQDSDDCWHPNKLEKQMDYASKHPECQMIYSLYTAHLSDGSAMLSPAEPLPEVMEGQMFDTLLTRNVIGAPTICISRAAFLQIGVFDTSYTSLEDWEFVLRAARQYSIGFVKEALMDVYILSDGVSSKVGGYFESRCRMLATYREVLQQRNLFDIVAMDILSRAKNLGILEAVQNMMLLYLQENA